MILRNLSHSICTKSVKRTLAVGLFVTVLNGLIAFFILNGFFYPSTESSSNRYVGKQFEGTVIEYREDQKGIIVRVKCDGYLVPVNVLISESTLFTDDARQVIDSRTLCISIEVYAEYWTQDIQGYGTDEGPIFPASIIGLAKADMHDG